MAVRRDVLQLVGPFDERLDAGTPTRSGGDHEMFARLLARGYRLVYEPAAVSWHRHRRTWAELRDTLAGYGTGVYAMWTGRVIESGELAVLKQAVRWLFAVQLPQLAGRWPGTRTPCRGSPRGGARRLRQGTIRLVRIRARQQRATPAMSATGPFATVVIPTHNRAASARATLGALAAQDCADAFEVVVVPNGCTDDTVERLRAIQPPLSGCAWREIDTPSASLARNTGADHARAPLVIFLDDDIAPAPSFVSAHLAAHDSEPDGGGPRLRPTRRDGLSASMRLQDGARSAGDHRSRPREAMFDRMREAGHRFGYADLLGATVRWRAHDSRRWAGSTCPSAATRTRELGFRLIAAGAQFVFAEDARGTHANAPSLARACERKRQEGRADVHLAQRFASLRPLLPLERPRTMRRRLCRGLAFRLPALGDLSTRGLLATLPLLDRGGGDNHLGSARWTRSSPTGMTAAWLMPPGRGKPSSASA